jgi:Domain of unknown function (DUF4136)
MNLVRIKLPLCLLVAAISITNAFAQKVSVGYDKSADFSRYASYSWAAPERAPSRPMLYGMIVASIDNELKGKGLTRVESGGDMVLIPAGGIEFGLSSVAGTPMMATYGATAPAIDATMWTGAGGSGQMANLTAPTVPEGTLVLDFVDRIANKVIWTGTVRQKLEMENKKKSLDLIDKAIAKLMKQFPPQKK